MADQRYARGGPITGRPDPTPIYTETLLAQRCGYVIPASAVRRMGVEILAKLNESIAIE